MEINYNSGSFRAQIAEDIEHIKKSFPLSRYQEDDYVFNHWILDNIYNVDEDIITSLITDASYDNEIDCFVCHNDKNSIEKVLYIIQNKYYSSTSKLTIEKVTKFLQQPLSNLNKGSYKNEDLQQCYNEFVENINKQTSDSECEWKIYLDLYTTEDDELSEQIQIAVENFNNENISKNITARIFTLKNIHDLYYGESFGKDLHFEHIWKIPENNYLKFGGISKIVGKDDGTIYACLNVCEIYSLIKEAELKKYPIFEDNIREYLGSNTINKKIEQTLNSDTERNNFFLYNNGITISCEDIKEKGLGIDKKHSAGSIKEIKLVKPQIINGCQTVNSIKTALKNKNIDDYKDCFVLVKLLRFSKENQETRILNKKIVEATNTQNSIKLADFEKNQEYFKTLKESFYNRGFLLEVIKSDKHSFKSLSKTEESALIKKAKELIPSTTIKKDIIISIEKLILIYMALIKNAHDAYTKKNKIFEKSSDVYKKVTKNIHSITTDTMIRMYMLYNRAEKEKKENNGEVSFPVPYYMFNTIGFLLDNKGIKTADSINTFFDEMSKLSDMEYEKVYTYLSKISSTYRRWYYNRYKLEYNSMIKKAVDYGLLQECINEINCTDNKCAETFEKLVKTT